METEELRLNSIRRLDKAGIFVPESLPLLENFSVRTPIEILDRIVCLNAVAAAAHGFDKKRALDWLAQEGMVENLTNDERSFLNLDLGDADAFKVQVEAMWALAWVVSIAPSLDFWRDCDPRFVMMLPDLKNSQSSAVFRASGNLRSEIEIGSECDFAYCLHWALRDAKLNGTQSPKGLTPYVLVERRRALEWIISTDDWDMVSLDT